MQAPFALQGRFIGVPPIICIEDREHTARCIMAIRERKRREAMAQVVERAQ